MRILIANRGEIARRIIRTAKRLGHETVAAWADPDADAPFVREATIQTRLGPAALAESYLSTDALLDAARRTGADAVHPGYGFVSENADFARAAIAAGLIWIGPKPEVIDQMGSKINARRLATSAGVPIIPGFDRDQDPTVLAEAARDIGYPVLVKAAAGGGGKGIRIVEDDAGFAPALAEAMAESMRSFGDDAMIVERYITQPRHVEVQIVGDKAGNVINLGTRECSVQRRYQKVLEEAPAPNLSDDTRAGLRSSATELARSIGYDSAGTVEFVVDAVTGDYFFLEMNTRLQVEHPITEAITGIDLVEQQIRSAAGEPLAIEQDDVILTGHAFEARINAEDPNNDFAPDTGVITSLSVPPGARWDSGIEEGSEISPYYDSMIAKLVVSGSDREAARRSMIASLDQLVLGGLTHNAGFHRWLIDTEPVRTATVTTRFLDNTTPPAAPSLADAAQRAGAAWVANDVPGDAGPWAAGGPLRLVPHTSARTVALRDRTGEVHSVEVAGADDGAAGLAMVDTDARRVAVAMHGHTASFEVLTRSEAWAPVAADGPGAGGNIESPFPAVVVEVHVSPGDSVEADQVVVVIEAMKMLHSLTASSASVVDEVRVAVGDTVPSGHQLVTFQTSEISDSPSESE